MRSFTVLTKHSLHVIASVFDNMVIFYDRNGDADVRQDPRKRLYSLKLSA